jgi:hypothetical protein
LSAKGSYYPGNVNMYVANLTYAADVALEGGKLTVDLTPTAPVAASATALLSATSIATAGSAVPSVSQTEALMGKFGRVLQLVASGAATSNVTVHGQDYLGQPMSESFTLNGTTIVNGVKAFRRVTRVDFGATAATTINLGVRDVFGLPYAFLDAGVDFTDGVKSGTQGAYATPALTAQTVTSADPRGTFTPHTSVAPNASRKYVLQYEPRRGDLYGQRHFFNG